MKTFKEYITEIGDTLAGKQALFRYAAKRIAQQEAELERRRQSISAADQQLVSNPSERNLDRLERMTAMAKQDVEKHKRRAIGVQRAIERISGQY